MQIYELPDYWRPFVVSNGNDPFIDHPLFRGAFTNFSAVAFEHHLKNRILDFGNALKKKDYYRCFDSITHNKYKLAFLKYLDDNDLIDDILFNRCLHRYCAVWNIRYDISCLNLFSSLFFSKKFNRQLFHSSNENILYDNIMASKDSLKVSTYIEKNKTAHYKIIWEINNYDVNQLPIITTAYTFNKPIVKSTIRAVNIRMGTNGKYRQLLITF